MTSIVDKARRRFLNSCHFGPPGGGRADFGLVVGIAVATGLAGGCSPQSASRPVEDSLTSGRIRIVAAPEAADLVARLARAFEALYPQASVEVRAGTARDAIGSLFGARADAAVIGRELEPEERAAAVRGRLDVEGYRFARDAVVAIVHPSNPLENIALEELRGIYEGRIDRWSQVAAGAGSIVPVVQPPESDVTAYFVEEVMGGEPVRARSLGVADDSAAVAAVLREPGAVAYVTLAWADRGAKALRLAGLLGLPYWKANAETVYNSDYPLTRFHNCFVRASGAKLANGFVTFITSRDGQRLVHESGLVPTTVPVRFVRRSPMQSTH